MREDTISKLGESREFRYNMNMSERRMTELTAKLTRIANRAVHKAQEENRKNGIPNMYVINGKQVWQLPDGSFTDKNPLQ